MTTLLIAFKRREGHTLVSRDHIEKGFRLGQWVAVQRYFQHRRRMLPERERRLNAVGFVWSRRDWLWKRGFAALQKFKRREGHCLVHALHIEDDVHLGNWVTVQRRTKCPVRANDASMSLALYLVGPRSSKKDAAIGARQARHRGPSASKLMDARFGS